MKQYSQDIFIYIYISECIHIYQTYNLKYIWYSVNMKSISSITSTAFIWVYVCVYVCVCVCFPMCGYRWLATNVSQFTNNRNSCQLPFSDVQRAFYCIVAIVACLDCIWYNGYNTSIPILISRQIKSILLLSIQFGMISNTYIEKERKKL